MKKALLIDTVRKIWATKGRFFSILAIIALGCGFFAGIKSTAPDMLLTASEYYDAQGLSDVHLISTLGFNDDDVASVKAAGAITNTGYSADLFVRVGENEDAIVKAYSADMSEITANNPEILNRPVLLDGRYPQKSDECLVEISSTSPSNFKLGNKISLNTGKSETDIYDIVNKSEFEIVGVIQSPLYISLSKGNTNIGNGKITSYILLPEEVFVYEQFTDIYLSFNDARGIFPYDDKYTEVIDSKIPIFEDIGDVQIAKKVSEIQDDLDAAKLEIEDGKAEYNNNLNKFNQEINDAKNQLIANNEIIVDNEKKYNDSIVEYEKGLAKFKTEGEPILLQLLPNEQNLDPQSKAILDSLLQNKAILEATANQLEEARVSLEDGKQKLVDGESELAEKRAEGEKKLNDAQQELIDGENEFSISETDAKEIMDNAKWFVLDRDSNPDYSNYEIDAERIDSIAAVFPVFFILVAALVCFTTMTRMVEEQRTEIGTLKALGYSRFSIMGQFLIYALIASVAGGFIGLIIGFKIFPIVIFNAYRMMYFFPDINAVFRWDYAIGCIIAAILCTGLSVILACYKELVSVPAKLMRPKSPKNGKRVLLEKIPFLWNKFSFHIKVTCRNIFRYKDRVFMTVIGIAGCTALMLTGFGLRHAISSIVEKQYGEIFKYDAMVILDDMAIDADKAALETEFSDSPIVSEYMYGMQKTVETSKDGKAFESILIAPENIQTIGNYFELKERISKKPLKLEADGVIINEKLGRMLNVGVGDTITIEGADVTISGVNENYTYNYIYSSAEIYEEIYGSSENNVAFVNMSDLTQNDAFSEDLLGNESVLMVEYSVDGGQKFKDIVKSLTIIVLVLIISAGALAFVVLYNLANINVNERIRELATIKVLGFYDMEVSGYIYRENTFSALIGMGVGLVLGVILEKFVVKTAEVDIVMFSPEIPITAFLFAGALTLLFTVFVNVILHFKLKKIDMASSMKAIE